MGRSSSTGLPTTPLSKSRNSPIPRIARAWLHFFLDELFRSGTTTAMVYCTVHPSSVEAFFAAAEARGARMIAGKVMMDRDAPDGAHGHRERGYDESKALIERWRGRGRLDYAITPRFAVTSTQAQLDAAGALAREFPRLLRPDPRQRKQGGDRARRRAVSRGAKLYRRLRAGGASRATFGVRPLHSFAGQRGRRARRKPFRRRILPDVKPFPRLRPVRSGAAQRGRVCGSRLRPTSAAARAIRCCARRPRATRCCSSTASRGRRSRRSTA